LVKTGSAMNMSTEDGFITDADVGFYEAIIKHCFRYYDTASKIL
jgi:hypothetical protein